MTRDDMLKALVKPLAWALTNGGVWTARTNFATAYSVSDSQWCHSPDRVWYWVDGGDEAAQAAAEADYRARIAAALDLIAGLVAAISPFAYEIDAPAMDDDRLISVHVSIGQHRTLVAALAAFRAAGGEGGV